MDKTIAIITEKGTMSVRLENFFPTTQKRCKQLKKVIAEDWKNESLTLGEIQKWLESERVVSLTYGTANIPRADKLNKNLVWMLS